jgi:GNAT superfamily N-acetyltransferase
MLTLSSPDLSEAADANLVVHAGWLQRRIPGMHMNDQHDLVVIDSGLDCDTFNIVCSARLDRSHATDRARHTIEYFRRAQRAFSWWVGPADRPADLGQVLVEVGLQQAETELAMAADLSLLPQADAPRSLHITRVRAEPELRAFARLNAANWTPPDAHVLRFYEQTAAALLAADCPLWLYVGYLDGEPVATSELTVGGGVVGLYNISTSLPYRGRGFGSALTVRPLLDARAQGQHTAILQAAAEGVRVYERVGFRAFGEITEYKPPGGALR